MTMLEVDEMEIESTIVNLRSDCPLEWDGIFSKLIKICVLALIRFITCICNLAISTGVFLMAYKTALAPPIRKSGFIDTVHKTALSLVISEISETPLQSLLFLHLSQLPITLPINHQHT